MPEDSRDVDVTFKEYVDARLSEVQRAADLALRASQEEGVPLREHDAALINGLREHVFAVMEEQRRGIVVAEQEREKAASALRAELERAITEGDRALRDHIENQIQQVKAALESAEKLEVQRFEATGKLSEDRLAGLRREALIVMEASTTAISKSEVATEKRFESVNEFRAQLASLISSFLPREVAEAQFAEVRRSIQEITDKISKVV